MTQEACENGIEHARPPRSMQLSELVGRCLGTGTPIAGEDRLIHDICIDSRRASPGSTFIAIRGTEADGTAFINDAMRRGAVAVISEQPATDVDSTTTMVNVTDARATASHMAATLYGLPEAVAAGYQIAGITGTNGKSTIAFMLQSIIRSAAQSCALLGTIHYDLVAQRLPAPLTTPDAVQIVQHLMTGHAAGARHAVLEVSSHSLDQHRVDGIGFAVAIFSNLTQDHLDYHGTMENYLVAKRRLFELLKPEAAAIVNADDPHANAMAQTTKARVVRFGLHQPADVQAKITRADLSGSRFTITGERMQGEFELQLAGPHNVSNALAAITAANELGIDVAAIKEGLQQLAHVPGRLQRVDSNRDDGPFVFVDYAHTDDALRNVLSSLRPLTKGNLWCVFGCGGDRDRGKRPKMARVVAELADRFVITSDNPRTEDPLAILRDIEAGLSADDLTRGTTEPDRAAAIQHAIEQLKPHDALVIAGKGHEDYQIIGREKIHFDDTEVARAALSRR